MVAGSRRNCRKLRITVSLTELRSERSSLAVHAATRGSRLSSMTSYMVSVSGYVYGVRKTAYAVLLDKVKKENEVQHM